jgi:hypothetical protein
VIFGPSFHHEIFFLALMVVLLDYSSIGMVFQILLRQVNFEVFLMVVARRIILAIFVPAAISSIMVIHILGSPTTSTRLFGLFSLEYWCWYSRRCRLIILMVVCVHVALALRLKSKIWEHLYWYLQVYGMIFVPLSFGCLQKNTRLCHGRRRV